MISFAPLRWLDREAIRTHLYRVYTAIRINRNYAECVIHIFKFHAKLFGGRGKARGAVWHGYCH